MSINIESAYPISQWIMGHARIHFRSGHVVERRMSRATAERLRLIVDDREAADRLQWSDTGWLQLSSEEVVLIEFEAEPELGWKRTADDRAKQIAHGHRGGILTVLTDWWENRGNAEPSYSPLAIAMLDRALSDGIGKDRLDRLFELFEGEAGAELVAHCGPESEDSVEPEEPETGEHTPPADAHGDAAGSSSQTAVPSTAEMPVSESEDEVDAGPEVASGSTDDSAAPVAGTEATGTETERGHDEAPVWEARHDAADDGSTAGSE